MEFLRNILLLSVFSTSLVFAQVASEPTADERIMKSIMQLVAASAIKDGLSNDTACNAKKFNQLPIEEFVNLLAQKDKSVQKDKEKFLSQINKTIGDALKAKLPDGRTVGQMNYEVMVQNAKNMQRNMPGQGNNYCEIVNDSSMGLFQKSLDNIRLLTIK